MTDNSKDRVANGAADAAEAGANYARAAREAASERLEEAQEHIDRAFAEGRHEFERAAARSGQVVRDNPLLAIAGAVGVGVLVGLALRSNR
ncbi:DUF883 family protein [Antarctobacter heliothermus]|uniref:Membrane-anchored ribosome-binding protein, inhibits growth in stationary phase, ElaB/YqjD/DUF883 family n=1 Tax=Antarctobacter heliothermus TaxID=74033 RepID=A0A239F6J1_9RHOB|nr:DUF883 family protein [Antarctobacter heliothermus]SNS52506.1 protein of unknown function [Antarctobacter heliothermus]